MSQNMAGQASAHTSDALAALAGEVASETNDTSSATLDADVDSTVKMMDDEARVASKNDNATLQMIQNRAAENANNVQAEINKVAAELTAVEGVTANASNSLNAVDRLLTGFEKQNRAMQQRARDAVQKKMADTFKSFNNDEEPNDAAPAPAPVPVDPGAFIETNEAAEIRANGVLQGQPKQVKVVMRGQPLIPAARPRLQSLLEQHDHLAKLHAGLSVRHAELGKQVSEVAELGSKFHQGSEGLRSAGFRK